MRNEDSPVYIPPNVLPPFARRFGGLLKKRWFRELVLLWPPLTGRRFSNKTEVYGVFQRSLISQLGQVSIYVHASPAAGLGTRMSPGWSTAVSRHWSPIPRRRDRRFGAAT